MRNICCNLIWLVCEAFRNNGERDESHFQDSKEAEWRQWNGITSHHILGQIRISLVNIHMLIRFVLLRSTDRIQWIHFPSSRYSSLLSSLLPTPHRKGASAHWNCVSNLPLLKYPRFLAALLARQRSSLAQASRVLRLSFVWWEWAISGGR